MPDYLGDDQRKTKEEEKDDAPIRGISKTEILKKDSHGSGWKRNVDISFLANVSSAR